MYKIQMHPGIQLPNPRPSSPHHLLTKAFKHLQSKKTSLPSRYLRPLSLLTDPQPARPHASPVPVTPHPHSLGGDLRHLVLSLGSSSVWISKLSLKSERLACPGSGSETSAMTLNRIKHAASFYALAVCPAPCARLGGPAWVTCYSWWSYIMVSCK